MYTIREADGEDEDVAATLSDIHQLTFFKSAPMPALGTFGGSRLTGGRQLRSLV
jgi:hypothetical protein